jgi:hypothetical protein
MTGRSTMRASTDSSTLDTGLSDVAAGPLEGVKADSGRIGLGARQRRMSLVRPKRSSS